MRNAIIPGCGMLRYARNVDISTHLEIGTLFELLLTLSAVESSEWLEK